jgi:hypothetical protein
MAAQFAAEATLRRVHAAQKDNELPPIEAILAPLEAELRLARQEVHLHIWEVYINMSWFSTVSLAAIHSPSQFCHFCVLDECLKPQRVSKQDELLCGIVCPGRFVEKLMSLQLVNWIACFSYCLADCKVTRQ